MSKKKLIILIACAVAAVAAVVLIAVFAGKGGDAPEASVSSADIEAGTQEATLPADPSQDPTEPASSDEITGPEGSEDASSESADGSSASGTNGQPQPSVTPSQEPGGIDTPDDVFDDPVSSTPAAADDPTDGQSSSPQDTPSSSEDQSGSGENITLPYSGEPIVLPTIKLN